MGDVSTLASEHSWRQNGWKIVEKINGKSLFSWKSVREELQRIGRSELIDESKEWFKGVQT